LRTLFTEFIIGLDKHASVNILWLIPVILAEYFEIWIIELNLNGYCLNCSESQSSGPGREGFHTDRFLLLRTPFCIEILPHKQG
jgi:hypothetical protein